MYSLHWNRVKNPCPIRLFDGDKMRIQREWHRFRCWLLLFIPVRSKFILILCLRYWTQLSMCISTFQPREYSQSNEQKKNQYHSIALKCDLFFPVLLLSIYSKACKTLHPNWINKHALQHNSNELKFMFYSLLLQIFCCSFIWCVLTVLRHKCIEEKKP